MEKLSGIDAWREIFVHAGSALGAKVSGFFPHLVAAFSILLLGWLLARVAEALSGRALRTVGLDRAAARLQLATVLERSEIHLTASQLVAKAVFWLFMLTAFLSAVETLGLTAVTATIDRLIAYIPNLIGAGLIGLLGVLAARVLGSVVRSAATAADFRSAPRLGIAVQWAVIGLVATVAAEQLGVATEILVAPLTALVGALTLSAGLPLRSVPVRSSPTILAGHFLKQSLPREGIVIVGGEQGVIERIGPIATFLRSDSKSWSVPNGRLLEDVVTRI
jgi:hypothetical protein